jgi:hypothetical protein
MGTIYKFKLTLEDEEEEFLREIEIDSNSTFEDFHYAIIEAAGFGGDELASFYICDNMWNRINEVTLLDMSEEENRIDIMSECKLKDFIKDHNQKLIYEYDFLNICSFLIELEKAKPPLPKTKYPRCIKSVGKVIHKAKSSSSSFIPADLDESDFEFPEKDFDSFNEDELAEGFGLDSEEFGDEFNER